MRQYRPGTVKIPDNAHPTVKFIYQQMQFQQIGYCDLAKRSGVDRNTIRSWGQRNSPSLVNVEAVLNALGYEIRLARLPQEALYDAA